MGSQAIAYCLRMRIAAASSGSRLPKESIALRRTASSPFPPPTAARPGKDDLGLGKTGLERSLLLGPRAQHFAYRKTASSESMAPLGLQGWRNPQSICGFAETAS